MPQQRKKDCTGKAYLSLSVYLYLLVYDLCVPNYQTELFPNTVLISRRYSNFMFFGIQNACQNKLFFYLLKDSGCLYGFTEKTDGKNYVDEHCFHNLRKDKNLYKYLYEI